MPDAFNHFFIYRAGAVTPLSRDRALSFRVPGRQVLPSFLESSKPWDTAGCCSLQKQPPEGRAIVEPLFGSEHSEAQHETRESQDHGWGGKGAWSSSRSTPSMGRGIFHEVAPSSIQP